jgi:hypothetical protein
MAGMIAGLTWTTEIRIQDDGKGMPRRTARSKLFSVRRDDPPQEFHESTSTLHWVVRCFNASKASGMVSMVTVSVIM